MDSPMTDVGAAAAGARAADGPFWAGHPDAATFERTHDERLERARRILDRLVAVTESRTIDNTLRLYDDLLLELDAVSSQSSIILNVHPDATLRAIAEKVNQRADSLATELSLDRRVYDALVALDLTGADSVTRYYVEKTLRDFRLAGVDQDEPTRKRLAELRDELVEIGQEFQRNIRSDVRTVTVAGVDELDGLPADYIARHPANPDGTITLTIDYPDVMPVFAYAHREDLRNRMFQQMQNRAYPANVEVLQRMLARRYELARLIGYPSWAEYVAADKMAGDARTISAFIDEVVRASGARAEREYQMLLERKRRDHPDATAVTAWESGYWSERVRKSQFDFDAQSVRPYFAYDRVKQGVLDVTSRLFGVRFERIVDAPVWHPAVECYELFEHGRLAGRFYLDMHPRADKYSHAAQFDVRTGVRDRQIPEAVLVCNFPGGVPDDPGLMEINDVRTFFHEFGHLLHNLLGANHRWVGIGGIRTELDFIEVPSQLLEEWTWDAATLATFARHYQTGETIPAETVALMKRANEFGKGLQVRRQMVYARISLSFYDRDPATIDTDSLVREINDRYQPFKFVDGTHMQCAFGHLSGYTAAYYAYMWSLVIAKDFFSKFDRTNLLDSTAPMRYRRLVLEPGGTAPAVDLVRAFLGRPFDNNAWRAWLETDS